MNFCPPVVPQSGTGGGKRFRNSALAEYQNRKNFVSLIEKIFARGRLKRYLENFSVLLAEAKRMRAETRGGMSPAGRQSKVNVRILFKESSNFVQNRPPIYTRRQVPLKLDTECILRYPENI
jgi:hypothetical protein